MEYMTKEQFVSRCMSDMAKKKRDKIRKFNLKETIFMGFVLDNHYKIERRIKGLKKV